jgi:2-keto-4-pentenoate hydratase/2-oxohepta-3-ene-1,7-dioic acid hydratase in catechol pathway
MRVVLYDGGRLGLVQNDVVHDVTALVRVPDPLRPGAAMQALIEQWSDVRDPLLASTTGSGVPLDRVRLDAPVRPGKIPSAPSNYRKHVAEMGSTKTIADRGIFLKAPSSVVGPRDTVRLPYVDRRTDHEAELAIVIGSRADHVTEADALQHVFGYTCLLDVTVRGQEERSMRKSFDTFTPIGPWIVTADEIANPNDLGVRCWVNDEVRQDGTTRDLVFDVPKLIAFTSTVMTLEPGDVIATGTPAGIGPIVDGDTLTVEIDGIGRMALPVSAAGATPCPFGPNNWTQPSKAVQGEAS